MAGRKITFEGVPQQLYISTSGGEGNRQLGLFLEVKNGTAPFAFSWSIDAGEFPVTPSFGSGTSNNATVQFQTSVYVNGGLSDYRLVGEGVLEVSDANGRTASVRVPVYAGQ